MLLIKTITVEAAPPVPYLPGLLGIPADAPPANAPGSRFARPGLPGSPPPAAPPKAPGLVTVLEEGALRVVMVIHVVKPPK